MIVKMKQYGGIIFSLQTGLVCMKRGVKHEWVYKQVHINISVWQIVRSCDIWCMCTQVMSKHRATLLLAAPSDDHLYPFFKETHSVSPLTQTNELLTLSFGWHPSDLFLPSIKSWKENTWLCSVVHPKTPLVDGHWINVWINDVMIILFGLFEIPNVGCS